MRFYALCFCITTIVVLPACTDSKQAVISYANQIQPIISKNCLECHKNGGPGFQASGLNMETYAGLIKGTKFGPVIKPGDALSSTLVRLIKGQADPSINMPHGGRQPLSDADISQIELWIKQGAKNN